MTRPDGSTTTVAKEDKSGVMTHNSFGKSRVRLSKVTRNKDRHDFKEIVVDVQLEGDFDISFTQGDNKPLVATDSMKNTVYVLAADDKLESIESFGKRLAEHFVKTYTQVRMSTVHLAEDIWQRIPVEGKPHSHAFFGAGDEKHSATIIATSEATTVESGIDGLRLVKTTASEFWGFVRDQYTTLPEVHDRIFGTAATVHWQYKQATANYQAAYEAVRKAVMEVFATHHSLGVQHTIYEIGQVALARVPEISEITITMPNEHRIVFDLKPFGLENKNEIFVATDEPFGLISATIKRQG